MTVTELAARLHRTQKWVREMLLAWEQDGIVEERAGGCWYLTEFGFSEFGRGLLDVDIYNEGAEAA